MRRGLQGGAKRDPLHRNSAVAASVAVGRGLGEQAPERPRAVYGAESLCAPYQRRAARGAPGRGLGAVCPKGGASVEVRHRRSMASAVRTRGLPRSVSAGAQAFATFTAVPVATRKSMDLPPPEISL